MQWLFCLTTLVSECSTMIYRPWYTDHDIPTMDIPIYDIPTMAYRPWYTGPTYTGPMIYRSYDIPAHGITTMIYRSWYTDHDIPTMACRPWYTDHDIPIMNIPIMTYRPWHTDHDIPIMIYRSWIHRSWHTDHDIPIMIYRSWYTGSWYTDLDIPTMIYRSWFCDHDIPIMMYRLMIYRSWYTDHDIPTMAYRSWRTGPWYAGQYTGLWYTDHDISTIIYRTDHDIPVCELFRTHGIHRSWIYQPWHTDHDIMTITFRLRYTYLDLWPFHKSLLFLQISLNWTVEITRARSAVPIRQFLGQSTHRPSVRGLWIISRLDFLLYILMNTQWQRSLRPVLPSLLSVLPSLLPSFLPSSRPSLCSPVRHSSPSFCNGLHAWKQSIKSFEDEETSFNYHRSTWSKLALGTDHTSICNTGYTRVDYL